MQITHSQMTVRAQKAFGSYGGSKAVTNLPTETQVALLTLETFLTLFARIVSVEAPVSARQRAVIALRSVI